MMVHACRAKFDCCMTAEWGVMIKCVIPTHLPRAVGRWCSVVGAGDTTLVGKRDLELHCSGCIPAKRVMEFHTGVCASMIFFFASEFPRQRAHRPCHGIGLCKQDRRP
jgi:hypothetical protein